MRRSLSCTSAIARLRKVGNHRPGLDIREQRRLTYITERKQAVEAAEAAKNLKRPPPGAPEPDSGAGRAPKAARGAGLKGAAGMGAGVVPDEYLPPNKILFIRQVPDDYGVDALTAIFSRFAGFREVRTVPGRKGIAFVEYVSFSFRKGQSIAALITWHRKQKRAQSARRRRLPV